MREYDQIIIPKEKWKKFRENPHFADLIEEIEDIIELEEAKKETESFMSFDEYDKSRID